MKEKAIVFGLGEWYRKYISMIELDYEVVALTSNNVADGQCVNGYIPVGEIQTYEYDCIIICNNDAEVEIVNQLVDECNVKIEKIRLVNCLYGKYADKCFFSQINEDAVVAFLLKTLSIEPCDVTYLELGTNHPVLINNTYRFYQLGGRGVLVEPDRNLKNLIRAIRPRDVLIDKAVSLDGKPATFYELQQDALSTLDYDVIEDAFKGKTEFRINNKYIVDTITVNDCFKMLDTCPDIFAMDIEGLDYEVLKAIDFSKYRPKIMIVEICAYGVKEQKDKEIKEYLEDNGYFCFHNNNLNVVYVDEIYYDVLAIYISPSNRRCNGNKL